LKIASPNITAATAPPTRVLRILIAQSSWKNQANAAETQSTATPKRARPPSRSTFTKRWTMISANPAPAQTSAGVTRLSVILPTTKNSSAMPRSTAMVHLFRCHCARARASASSAGISVLIGAP
jgi:hypothetical protein